MTPLSTIHISTYVRSAIIILLLVQLQSIHAKPAKLLGRYKFEEGGYAILGVFSFNADFIINWHNHLTNTIKINIRLDKIFYDQITDRNLFQDATIGPWEPYSIWLTSYRKSRPE